jgi:hypothetical protein
MGLRLSFLALAALFCRSCVFFDNRKLAIR